MPGRPNPPRTIDPLVSVVIVAHGSGHLLTGCLRALREHTREKHEVIVLDSASPDGTGEWAGRALRDARVHASERNLGFGALSNAGVIDARAPYVLLLNADVTVGPNWLPPLLDVLESRPDVAAVAPLMRNPDGTVQEYGSVVTADGWTQALTADGLPEPLVRRTVDYVSAACLLVRRGAFNAVGGFAPEYHIAYFEDVDLAYALRAAGWSTMVEPRSSVTHERHGSSGSERARQLMEHNHGTFAARWAAELRDRPTGPLTGHRLAQARDLTAVERILVIDDRVPNADRGSGDPRTQRFVEALTGPGRLVTFLARDASRAGAYAGWLVERGVEVVWGVEDVTEWLRGRTGCYDVVIVSRPVNWEWAAAAIDLTQPQATRVYDAEALFHRRLDQTVEDTPLPYLRAEADRVRDAEAAAFTWADLGVCITSTEAEWARTASVGTPIHLVGYPADVLDPMPRFADRSGLAFFGGFMSGPGSPNEESVLELAADVWPDLLRRHPYLTLTIVGADPTAAVRALALADERVDVVGRVPQPSWWLGRALLHLAPMRYGAGLKLKFVESMAAGLPFLTTPLGAEGLLLGRLTPYLVSTSPAEMVDQAHRLLSDEPLWTDVQESLLDLVAEHFSPPAFTHSVNNLLLACALAPQPTP